MSKVEEDTNPTEKDSKKVEETSVESAVKEESVGQEKTTATADGSNANEENQAVVKDNTKIDILLKATGNAPIMKKKKWTVSPDQHIGWISDFIKRYLKLDSSERLFLYINQTFAPAPDQTVQNLYDCYGTDGKLIIHYCKSQAWG